MKPEIKSMQVKICPVHFLFRMVWNKMLYYCSFSTFIYSMH